MAASAIATSRLRKVYAGLSRLRRYRTRVRVGSGVCAFTTILLAALLAGMLVDALLHMGRLERIILDAVLIGIGYFAWRRTLGPALRTRESDEQLALLVERNQGIPGDLIAALQFNDDRSQFGSNALRDAVVEYVDEFSLGLNFLDGFDTTRLKTILKRFVIAAVVSLAVLAIWPGHVKAYVQRLFLSNTHYPTDTRIVGIESPGQRAAYGQAVPFRVRLAGEMPDKAVVELTPIEGSASTVITLRPDETDPNLYVGQLDHIYDDLEYVIRAGDAYTEPTELHLVPLPKVTLRLDVDRPAYAGADQAAENDAWRAVVLEGSTVRPVVSADKPLRSATCRIGKVTWPLTQQNGEFALNVAGTPLEAVEKTTGLEIQVVDTDGLSLEQPISAMVIVREDRPPRIGAVAVSRLVLPEATPRVVFEAVDDFGLREIVLLQTIVPVQGESRTEQRTLMTFKDHPRQVKRSITIPLAPLKLAKGDRVEITLEAVDYRGKAPGEQASSPKIVFEVTDREGLEEALQQSDELLDRRLDEIIRAQLRIGGK